MNHSKKLTHTMGNRAKIHANCEKILGKFHGQMLSVIPDI